MTLHIADIASYQLDLPLTSLAVAGFTGINVKVSHGIGQKGVHARVSGYVSEARERGWKLSSFHYLTGDAPGDAQARHAYSRLFALDLHKAGAVHVLDCEDVTVTESIFTSYVNTMMRLLDRPFALYTGDWYEWNREWCRTSPHMPWLWAAPKIGYLTKYPGDKSEHWEAKFASVDDLSVMQYKVGIIGGVKVSQSAVRDEKLWTEMSGEMTYAPESILEVRREFQKHVNLSNAALGIVRNERDTSYHVGESWLISGAYSQNESPRDKNPTEASSAIDIGFFEVTGTGNKRYTLYDYNRWLVNECKKGAKDTLDIREVIYSLDGVTVLRWDRLKIRTSGAKSHTTHTHKSWFRDSENRDRAAVTKRWFRDVVFKPLPKPEEETVDLDTVLWDPKKPPEWTQIYQGFLAGANPTLRNVLLHSMRHAAETGNAVDALAAVVKALTEKVDALAEAHVPPPPPADQ